MNHLAKQWVGWLLLIGGWAAVLGNTTVGGESAIFNFDTTSTMGLICMGLGAIALPKDK